VTLELQVRARHLRTPLGFLSHHKRSSPLESRTKLDPSTHRNRLLDSMSMAGVNPAAAGGPVGGGNMMMINDGSPAMANGSSDQTRNLLNTYIYEYFIKIGMYDIARSLSQQSEKFKINVAQKQSPGQRKGGIDGNDADAMDVDNKMDIPEDLPRPSCPNSSPGTAFLVEWFGIFYDIFQASSRKGSAGPAQQYLMHAQVSTTPDPRSV
jgi:hypothetical protein